MAVITIEEDGSGGRDCVDPIFAGKLYRRELLVVPIAALQPLTFGSARDVLGNSLYEFFFSRCALEVDLFKTRTTRDEVHMSVVETGQKRVPVRIDDAGLRTAPARYRSVGAYCNDAVAEHCHGLSIWARRVNCPNLRVVDDEVSGGSGLRERGCGTREKKNEDSLEHGRASLHELGSTARPTSALLAGRQRKCVGSCGTIAPGAWICGRGCGRRPGAQRRFARPQ